MQSQSAIHVQQNGWVTKRVGGTAAASSGTAAASSGTAAASKADFSFLRNFLFVGGIAILGVGILSMFGLFGGFHVGTIISGAIVALMCGYILYDTSLIMHHLPTTAHVAGAMMIFGSIAQLFRHILFLLLRFRND